MLRFDWFKWFTKHPVLKFLFLELTDCCNLQCKHCGSSCSAKSVTFLPKETISKLLRRVAQVYPPSQMMLCITGGEPLLHPDFFEIMEDASSLGFVWGMTTNATLITPEVAQKLKNAGMATVSVSLDGLRDQHNWLRQSPDAYERAVRGIQAMQDIGQPVQITTVIHRQNIGSMDEMFREYCRIGAYSWKPINIEPIGRAKEEQDLLLAADEHRRLLSYIREKREDPSCPMHVTYGCSHFLPEEFNTSVRAVHFRCGAGIFIAAVQCTGDIGGCLDIERRPELVQGNVHTDDFVEVWEKRFRNFRKDRAKQAKECRRCPQRANCHGDSAHTWDYDNRKPMLCLHHMLNEEQEE